MLYIKCRGGWADNQAIFKNSPSEVEAIIEENQAQEAGGRRAISEGIASTSPIQKQIPVK